MTFSIKTWLIPHSNFVAMLVNTLIILEGMMKSEWLEARESRLGALERVSNALWESLDCQVRTFEVGIKVRGSRSKKTLQMNE